jgi:hypothetical protein
VAQLMVPGARIEIVANAHVGRPRFRERLAKGGTSTGRTSLRKAAVKAKSTARKRPRSK